jgi:hypothetical protein
MHDSDHRLPFKNNVIKQLHRLTGTNQHYMVDYSTWVNGTSVVINLKILQVQFQKLI